MGVADKPSYPFRYPYGSRNWMGQINKYPLPLPSWGAEGGFGEGQDATDLLRSRIHIPLQLWV